VQLCLFSPFFSILKNKITIGLRTQKVREFLKLAIYGKTYVCLTDIGFDKLAVLVDHLQFILQFDELIGFDLLQVLEKVVSQHVRDFCVCLCFVKSKIKVLMIGKQNAGGCLHC
jgi:hypothetical protein